MLKSLAVISILTNVFGERYLQELGLVVDYKANAELALGSALACLPAASIDDK